MESSNAGSEGPKKNSYFALAAVGVIGAIGAVGIGTCCAVKSAIREEGDKTRQEAKEAVKDTKNGLAKDILSMPLVKDKVDKATKAGSATVLDISKNCKELTDSGSSKVVVTLNDSNGDKSLSTSEGAKQCKVVKKGNFYTAEYTDGSSSEAVKSGPDYVLAKSPSMDLEVEMKGDTCALNVSGFKTDTQIPEVTKRCRETVDNAYSTAQLIEALALAKANQ
jgi:hypothetical protein